MKIAKEAEMLLSDLCTPKEIENMKERFVIASLLKDGYTYQQIVAICKTSTATVTRVARFLHAAREGGYKLMLNRIEKTQ